MDHISTSEPKKIQSQSHQTNSDVEIIDFYRPLGNGKNLFVCDIFMDMEENEAICKIQNSLFKSFSKFGLLYEIQVFPVTHFKQKPFKEMAFKQNVCLDNAEECLAPTEQESAQSKEDEINHCLKYYAFVKFYSVMCAQRAKLHLHMTPIFGTKPIKVSFASRKKSESREMLYLNNCYDLANFYLGFNGWTSNILMMKKAGIDQTTIESNGKKCYCGFLCITELTIPWHGLATQGVGTAEADWDLADPGSKSSAIHRCRKQSYQRALQNAFSKLLIISLGNGKVHVEIDTTLADPMQRLESLKDFNLLTINELEEEPDESSGDERDEGMLQLEPPHDIINDKNVKILMELDTEGCG